MSSEREKEQKLRKLFFDSKLSLTCRNLDISEGHTLVTDLNHGNPDSLVFFVGEAPGSEEDKEGIPFVGRAGKLFNKKLQKIGFCREDVWVSNIVKFRPTENNGSRNRKPYVNEVRACLPILKKEIEIVDPAVIVTLGLTALKNLTGEDCKMQEIAGKKLDYKGKILFPMYHPAAAVYQKKLEDKITNDFEKLNVLLKKVTK